MAFVIADRVKETTTTAGNGTVTLLGASAGYQSFAAVGNGNTTYYCIAGQTTSEWEVGIGTYTSSGTTLSRDTVLSSSNSGNKVVFSAGTKDVFVTYPSQRAVTTDTTQTLTNKTLSSGSDWNGNAVPVSYGGTGASFFTTDIVPYYNGSTYGSTNIYYSSGNVGIVESSPTTLLDVGAYFGDPFRVSTSYSDVSIIWAYRQSGVRTNKFRISYDYTNVGFYVYDITNSATRLYINNSGDIGIGTTTPGNKLEVSGTFSASGVATFSAGTVTAPAITTSGDTNNGIYFPAADNVAITTDGTQRLLVDSSGNVGIGTSSPTAKLDVVTSANLGLNYLNLAYDTGGGSGWIGGYNVTYNSGVKNVATGALNAIWYSSDSVRVYTNSSAAAGTTASERMRIDSSGNVGIGTSSPGAKLAVSDGTVTLVTSPYGAGSTGYFGTSSNHTLALLTNNSERMRIDSSGNVGIRTSSPVSPLTVYQASSGTPSLGSATYYGPVFQNSFGGYGLGININSASGISLIQSQRFDGTATAYDIALNPLGGNVGIGTSTPTGSGSGYTTLHVNNATNGGQLHLSGGGSGAASTDGSLFTQANTELFINNQEAGPVNFYVNGSERMRIANNGDVRIGGTTARDVEKLSVYQGGGGSNYGICFADNGGNNAWIGSGGGPGLYFRAGAGNPVGTLNSSGNFIDASDKAYKKDVSDIQYGLSTVLSLAPKSYRLIANNRAGVGFIAQDMEQVIPEIVSGEEGTKGIAYGQLTAVLVKAIQEQQQQIDALKAEVAALKGN